MTAKTAQLLTTPEFADRAQISTETARKWRRDGRGPAYIRDGEGFIRYREADVEAWERSRRVVPGAA